MQHQQDMMKLLYLAHWLGEETLGDPWWLQTKLFTARSSDHDDDITWVKSPRTYFQCFGWRLQSKISGTKQTWYLAGYIVMGLVLWRPPLPRLLMLQGHSPYSSVTGVPPSLARLTATPDF